MQCCNLLNGNLNCYQVVNTSYLKLIFTFTFLNMIEITIISENCKTFYFLNYVGFQYQQYRCNSIFKNNLLEHYIPEEMLIFFLIIKNLYMKTYFKFKRTFPYIFLMWTSKKSCLIWWTDVIFITDEGNWDLFQLRDMPSSMVS